MSNDETFDRKMRGNPKFQEFKTKALMNLSVHGFIGA